MSAGKKRHPDEVPDDEWRRQRTVAAEDEYACYFRLYWRLRAHGIRLVHTGTDAVPLSLKDAEHLADLLGRKGG